MVAKYDSRTELKQAFKCNMYYLYNCRLPIQDNTEKFVVLSSRS